MAIILTIIYILVFTLIIYKAKFFKIEGYSKKYLILAFYIKIISGAALIAIYTFYYGGDRKAGDVFKYFDDGKVIHNLLDTNPTDYFKLVSGIGEITSESEEIIKEETGFWYKAFNYNLYNDNRTIIRFNAIAFLFSFGSIWVHTVFMAFLSFIGLTAILKVFNSYFNKKRIALYISVYLIPSVLLWTSGILKEGILVFAFGLLFYHVVSLSKNKINYKNIIWVIITTFLLMISKFYILVAALPALIAIIWVYKTNHKHTFLKFAAVYIIYLIIGFNSGIISEKYDFVRIINNKQHDFQNMVNAADTVGSAYEIPQLEPNAISIIKNSPIAFYNAFTKPSVLSTSSLMTIPAAIENAIFILLLILGVFFNNLKSITNKALLLFSVIFVINLFVLSGLSTPVIGALVRYKAPVLPFLAIALFMIIDFEKIKQLLKY